MKSNLEENEKIKAPTRDYTEIDFNKPKYKADRKREEKIYLQKPQFKTSNNNKDSNFVQLDKEKDVKIIFLINNFFIIF